MLVAYPKQKEDLCAPGDPTQHAELRAIQGALQTLGRHCMLDCTLYVTLEPCPMCAGALLQARVGSLVYGAKNPLLGVPPPPPLSTAQSIGFGAEMKPISIPMECTITGLPSGECLFKSSHTNCSSREFRNATFRATFIRPSVT